MLVLLVAQNWHGMATKGMEVKASLMKIVQLVQNLEGTDTHTQTLTR
jgi:hypothetical protein